MTTRLKGYLNNTIDTDDTYILAMLDNESRPGRASVSLTRNSAYDGTITVKARPRGSSAAFKAWHYEKSDGTEATATLGGADAEIGLNLGAHEYAFVTTGRTVGSMTVDVAPGNDV